MNKVHHVESVTFTRARMLLTVDGQPYSLALADVSERLAQAAEFEREQYEVSPSGYGIHWPLVDEDLTVDGLLRLARPEPGQSSTAARAHADKIMVVSEPHASYVTPKPRPKRRGGV
jgi:hypothetical protein